LTARPRYNAEVISPALRHRFTIEQYHQMIRAGVFTEDDRIELIEGEIVHMSPIGSRHAACVNRLTRIFTLALGMRAVVAVQNPVRLGGTSEPQPDVALLAPRSDFYASSHPTASEILLLVEVSESTADYDRDEKLELYARTGVREFWLVDLQAGRLQTYRRPSGEPYGSVRTVAPAEAVSPEAFGDVSIRVADILP
jgi:Uma2 family endonuclease